MTSTTSNKIHVPLKKSATGTEKSKPDKYKHIRVYGYEFHYKDTLLSEKYRTRFQYQCAKKCGYAHVVQNFTV